MYQTDEDVIVQASVPGVKPEEVDVTITGDTLTIKGETKTEGKVKKGAGPRRPAPFFRMAIRYSLCAELDLAGWGNI